MDQEEWKSEAEDTVSIELPTIEEPSPFDFILDPQRLITETDGAKYGSSTFETGATLFFENVDGDYDFSSRSDMLTITNKGTVPVEVTVTAWLDQIIYVLRRMIFLRMKRQVSILLLLIVQDIYSH